MRYFVLLLLLCNTVCGLFEKPSLLWCTERELQAILQGPQEFKAILGQHSQQDKIRLQHVWQKRSNLLWYESDVCLGLKVLSVQLDKVVINANLSSKCWKKT